MEPLTATAPEPVAAPHGTMKAAIRDKYCSPAGVELRALLRDLRVPAVIVVNRCDDAVVARRLARSLGALDGEAAVPCQLIDPDSGREVVVEILLTLLASMESTNIEVA